MTDKAKLPPEGKSNRPASTGPASGGEGGGAAKTGEAALEESLAEVNFFVQQGLLAESIHMLRELKKTHGDHPRIIGRENAVRVLLRQKLSASGSQMKAAQAPAQRPAGSQTGRAQPAAAAPQNPLASAKPQQPAAEARRAKPEPVPDEGATVVTRPPAATLDRLRKLKERARAGTGPPAAEQKPAEQKPAVPSPAAQPESDLPPPLPPVPEVQDTRVTPKPLYPARSMTLPMGSAPAAVPTDKKVQSESRPSPVAEELAKAESARGSDFKAMDTVPSKPQASMRAEAGATHPREAEPTQPDNQRIRPLSDSAVRVYPAPADGLVSPLLPFHDSEDDMSTDVFRAPKDGAEEARKEETERARAKVEPVKPAEAAEEPAPATVRPTQPPKLRAEPAESVELAGEELEQLKQPEEQVEPVLEKKSLFTRRNLLIAACIPLAALVVVLLIIVLKSGPDGGAKKTDERKLAAAQGDSAGDASTGTTAAADAAIETPPAATVDGSTAPPDSGAEPDGGTTPAAGSSDGGTTATTPADTAARPDDKPTDDGRDKPATDRKVRVKLIIMPRDAIVVVIFRGKKYWGTKFVSPKLTPVNTPETIRVRSRIYKDFNLTVTLDQNISRVISLQRKKKRMRLFDLKLKEKK